MFAAASEAFSQKNINCSIAESIARFEPVFEAARHAGVRVRGYMSCVVACPYEGADRAAAVADVREALYELGSYEVSLGDTIGTGTPATVQRMLEAVVGGRTGRRSLRATSTTPTAWRSRTSTRRASSACAVFDSSVAGLGGCPYAKGATGNVATEDVVYLLHGLGAETGIDLDALVECGVDLRLRVAGMRHAWDRRCSRGGLEGARRRSITLNVACGSSIGPAGPPTRQAPRRHPMALFL